MHLSCFLARVSLATARAILMGLQTVVVATILAIVIPPAAAALVPYIPYIC